MLIALNQNIAGRLDEVSRILAEQGANQFPGQTLSISQPAFRSQLTADAFASSPRHGRGDTPYFARTPVIAPGGKCSAKRLLALRKSLNVNDLIFQTVEDGLKLNPLDLVDCDLVFGPVVKFGGSGRLMRSHLLGMLEPASILQVHRQPVARQEWHPTGVRNPAFRARFRMAVQALPQ